MKMFGSEASSDMASTPGIDQAVVKQIIPQVVPMVRG